MKKSPFRKYALLLALLSGSALMFGSAGDASAAHPAVGLKDATGAAIPAASNIAYSAAKTCGGCHNYSSIEQHSYHAQLGANQMVGFNAYNPDHTNPYIKGVATKGKPWVQSPGHAGKW